MTPSRSSPGTAELRRARRAGRDQDRVVAAGLEGGQVADRRSDGDLDAEVADVLDVTLDGLDRETVGRNGQAEEPARLGRGLEDLDGIAEPCQLPGCGQAGRPAADDRDLLAVRRSDLDPELVVRRVVRVGDEPLDPPDRERPFERAASALTLTGGVAGPPESPDERGGVEDEPVGLLVLAAPDERDVPVSLDPCGAGEGAGRRALPVDDGLLRHGLRKGDVGGPAGDQVVVELVGDGDRAGLLAQLAAGAGHLVDEAGLLPDPVARTGRRRSARCRPPRCRSSPSRSGGGSRPPSSAWRCSSRSPGWGRPWRAGSSDPRRSLPSRRAGPCSPCRRA